MNSARDCGRIEWKVDDAARLTVAGETVTGVAQAFGAHSSFYPNLYWHIRSHSRWVNLPMDHPDITATVRLVPESEADRDAELRRPIEALAEKWEKRAGPFPGGHCHSIPIHEATDSLRAVLDAAPAPDLLTTVQADLSALAVCDGEHGHEGNPATVYGHFSSRRTCLRLHDDTWIYDPRWES